MTTPDFIVAIPARHDATRLPGKPLRALGGEPLVLHVVRRALAAGAREVWVAADDSRIADALRDTPARIAMTSSAHASGSDRLAECADIAAWDDAAIVVNLQGDEPFAPPAGIRRVAELVATSGAPMSTLAAPVLDAEQAFEPNAVKLVRNAAGDALYFSRAPIPWHRDAWAAGNRAVAAGEVLRHIGVYGYRAGALRAFARLPRGRLEQLESLEQLRALEAGWRIAVDLTPEPFPPGVDTPGDLARAEATLAALAAEPVAARPLRLLVVCLGNICRSPMAEGALRSRLRQAGLDSRVEVDSVGTGDWHVGGPPDRRAIDCAARNNVDIGGLRARQLCPADFERFDAILCADRSTLRIVRTLAPAPSRERCMLLSEYAGQGQVEVPDPYTGGRREFDHAWALVDGMAEAIVARLATTDSR